MNRWKIPLPLEALVVARDLRCIYCNRHFTGKEGPLGQRRSWEHIVNDASIISEQNIALCCISCNASKGAKPLAEWLLSNYCKTRDITTISIAEIARRSLGTYASGFVPI